MPQIQKVVEIEFHVPVTTLSVNCRVDEEATAGSKGISQVGRSTTNVVNINLNADL